MKTILVVDDEQAVTLAIELVLTDLYFVVKVSTGEEALLAIQARRPDAVILDVMMPGIGGLETLKILRAQPAYRRLAVLLMSEVRPMAKKSTYGWDDFILKPFSASDLIEALDKMTR